MPPGSLGRRGARSLAGMALFLLAACAPLELADKRFPDFFLPLPAAEAPQPALAYNCLVVTGVMDDPARVEFFQPAAAHGLRLPAPDPLPGQAAGTPAGEDCPRLEAESRGGSLWFPARPCLTEPAAAADVRGFQLDFFEAGLLRADGSRVKLREQYACWRDFRDGRLEVRELPLTLRVREAPASLGGYLRAILTLGLGTEDGFNPGVAKLHTGIGAAELAEDPHFTRGGDGYPPRVACRGPKPAGR